MHESSLAKQLLQFTLERAQAENARRILRVRGWIAETETLSAPSLEFHFQAHAKGTPAEGAALDLRLVHVEARCLGCGTPYRPEHHILLCPACGSTEGAFLGATGIALEAMEVE